MYMLKNWPQELEDIAKAIAEEQTFGILTLFKRKRMAFYTCLMCITWYVDFYTYVHASCASHSMWIYIFASHVHNVAFYIWITWHICGFLHMPHVHHMVCGFLYLCTCLMCITWYVAFYTCLMCIKWNVLSSISKASTETLKTWIGNESASGPNAMIF
jgi:hypothetical protein